ncbi:efflux transporter outer membrane subunit [Flavobacterium sp. RHBU_3]|uniref:efflux transporter outer membrane subunit n=1 Tax=Flavobacterium sp. RHBU_3 TaxID=3391184 RepID=UPI003984F121
MRNNLYKIAFAITVGVLLQSCFAAKEYKRPNVKAENLYRTEAVAQDSASLADIKWDKMFTDPILQGHIKKGLQNNFDARVALQNIASAEAYMKQGKAGYFPTLSGTASWQHQELAKNSQFGSFFNGSLDTYLLTGNLSWEADIWGKIRSNKRAYNATYLQTIAANQTIKTTVIANVASMYYQLLAYDEQLKVAETTLQNRVESIETIKALKDGGSTTEVAVKQTEAQKYATEITIADIKNNIILTENSLCLLLGEAPHKIERSTFAAQEVNPEIKLGYSASLLKNRPDVISAEYGLVNAFELTNVARSAFYPSLTITAQGGLQSIDLKTWFSTNSLFASILSGLTQPIFNQRQIRTKYEAAKATQEAAYVRFEQSVVTASREVSDALANYNNADEKIALYEKQTDALKTAADYSDELLNYGMVNYLEVLTAKATALSSELSLIDMKYRKLSATITLYKALGGGWK